jgi:hypothetical protein
MWLAVEDWAEIASRTSRQGSGIMTIGSPWRCSPHCEDRAAKRGPPPETGVRNVVDIRDQAGATNSFNSSEANTLAHSGL